MAICATISLRMVLPETSAAYIDIFGNFEKGIIIHSTLRCGDLALRPFSVYSMGDDFFSCHRHFENFGCFWIEKLPIWEKNLLSAHQVGGKNKIKLKCQFFFPQGQFSSFHLVCRGTSMSEI